MPLEIKPGRYVRKKLTERLSRLCNCNVQDEIHFIYLCPNMNNIRLHYFCKLNIGVGENYMEHFIGFKMNEKSQAGGGGCWCTEFLLNIRSNVLNMFCSH